MVPLHVGCPLTTRQGQPSAAFPLQFCQLGAHVYAHVPFEQLTFSTNGSPLQFTEPAPHAHGLFIGVRHAPLHSDVPLGHTHAPFSHVAPLGHVVVHEPQWSGSLDNVTQAPPQLV